MDVKTAVEIIASSVDAREAIEKLDLLPCRLHALLTSRAFTQAMEDYRIVTRSIITIRAGQFGGWMMGNLAHLTDGRNEDSARKACMAGLSQAMDGHLRPAPGRPAKRPAFPAHPPQDHTRPTADTCQTVTSRERERPEPTSPSKPTPEDLRKEILDFIQNAPSTLEHPRPAPSSIDKDRQTSTEIYGHDFTNTMHNKELHLGTHPKELPLAQPPV
jgi:hypothetical protein